MKYKIYEGLSDYLIAPDGTVIHQKTAQVVPFERIGKIFTVKMITDETHTFLNGKKKPIRLVRRFTREQILKMYAQSKVEFKDDLAEVPFTQEFQAMADRSHLEPERIMKARSAYLSVKENPNGAFQPHPKDNPMLDQLSHEISIASDDLGEISPLSVPVGQWLQEAGKISQKQMDQLAASKRTVKTNPKTKKSEVKKVIKALKKVNGSKYPVALKIPYFRIDGVEYQSARKAAEAVGVSVNTVLKRAKANKDGWFYVES